MSDKLKIKIHGSQNTALLKELIDEFLAPTDYEILPDDGFRKDKVIHIGAEGSSDRDDLKREIFRKLSHITGRRPDWGILTGVRPVKLAGEMIATGKTYEEVREIFLDQYYLTEEKADLLLDIYDRQYKTFGKPDPGSVGVYIGIPFCPTRCSYCSFASNQVGKEEIDDYMPALLSEIRYVADKMQEHGLAAETIYIGGGTPTTLDHRQLETLIEKVADGLVTARLREFTCEAGRPDTIDRRKLRILKDGGVDRVSINPQSMKQQTLDLIGRSHSPDDIREAFGLVMEEGFRSVNSDVIAGLPEEEPQDLTDTIRQVIDMGADNITVHTLAVKRSSRLHEEDSNYHYRAEDTVKVMLKQASSMLSEEGFLPYYLYRQKHMAGAYENTGYCREEKDCLYNVRIMDEHQTIIAIGAGGITKRYYPDNNRLERIPNVTNYRQYIDRIDEMIMRKETSLWR